MVSIMKTVNTATHANTVKSNAVKSNAVVDSALKSSRAHKVEDTAPAKTKIAAAIETKTEIKGEQKMTNTQPKFADVLASDAPVKGYNKKASEQGYFFHVDGKVKFISHESGPYAEKPKAALKHAEKAMGIVSTAKSKVVKNASVTTETKFDRLKLAKGLQADSLLEDGSLSRYVVLLRIDGAKHKKFFNVKRLGEDQAFVEAVAHYLELMPTIEFFVEASELPMTVEALAKQLKVKKSVFTFA